MLDLFGDTNTSPYIPSSRKSSRLLNSAFGFSEWWKAWPAGPRKVAKQQALDKWARFECATSATLILQHTEWMKTQPDWLKDNGAFICAPLVYLNQQRWADWQPEPERPKKQGELERIKAHIGAPMPDSIKALRARIRGVT
jgi:hypothetical protein